MERILYEVKKVVVGQDHFLERVLVAMLAQGHLLVEGVPGLAKTLTVKTLARDDPRQLPPHPVHARPGARRPRRHAHLQPEDRRVRTPRSGPVFCNLLLADEINRAPAKVQSALLEVMQERQVTIAGETHQVPEPFLVMATQNPIETEGTYPLPEAQVDRFMMKVLVGYPTEEEEFVIVERVTGAVARTRGGRDHRAARARCSASAARATSIPRSSSTRCSLVAATRDPERYGLKDLAKYLTYGASPRASIHLIEGARALAFLRGRDYVLPEDVTDLVPDVLRHRLVLSYEALAEGADAPTSCSQRVMQQVARARQAAGDPCPSRRPAEQVLKRSCAGSSGR